MPSIFYEIFNNIVNLDSKNFHIFIKELINLFKELEERKDIDNLKVLRNRLENLIDSKRKKVDKKNKKEFKRLEEILDDINDSLERLTTDWEKVEIIDVVKKIEKNYKVCDKIEENKSEDYVHVCVKKSKINYEKELIRLQLELLKLQNHIKKNWEKLLIIFEWRDAAWKGWTIKRFREYLNPRWAKVVALEKPTDLEKTQWYFQRYVNYLPSWWQMTFFDRSWYNRAWVEAVMWFVDKKNYEQFLEDVPKFEKMLTDSWVKLVKFYFSVSKAEQAKRFEDRIKNPLKQYKLSPIDQFSQQLWDKYSLAEYKNFKATNTKENPWTIVISDDKKKARLNAIKYLLNQFDYPEKIDKKYLKIDNDIIENCEDKIKSLKKEINVDDNLFE